MLRHLKLLILVAARWAMSSWWDSVYVIKTVKTYWAKGKWCFDDLNLGIMAEPFSQSIGAMIDVATVGIPDADDGFRLSFSSQPFPGYEIELDLMGADIGGLSGGAWYRWERENLEGWLCDVLYRYFREAPSKLYVRVDPIT